MKGFPKSTPGKIRTSNLLIRSQVLYPVKLRAQQVLLVLQNKTNGCCPSALSGAAQPLRAIQSANTTSMPDNPQVPVVDTRMMQMCNRADFKNTPFSFRVQTPPDRKFLSCARSRSSLFIATLNRRICSPLPDQANPEDDRG